ncbi:glycosyltransferase [Ferruginibacter sp. SUN106]|uniref:glycosyltransferase family 4 protein n=1 Tax=Ferruginibacter sp. SUN106 TaxID=2978348 RepID=UPI003D35E84F
MKILFGIHGTSHKEIAQSEIVEFQNRGFQTIVCTYGNWGSVNGLINSFKLIIKNAVEIKKQAAAQQSDFIYLNTGLDFKTVIRDAITVFILKRGNIKGKIVLKIHGSQNEILFSKTNLLKKYLFRKTDLFLLLSEEEKYNFLSIGLAPEKVQVTANVIDKSLYAPDPEFKKTIGVAESTSVLLFVGRFMYEKGIIDLVEACRLLKKESLDFRLVCLGNGPLFDEVQGLIKTYGLEENIKTLGHIPESETRYYYANCEMSILPTYHSEGFPMAVFQAVGAGRPVITTNIRAATDYFKEYENCLWVEKKNPAQLAKQIANLMKDKNLQQKMRDNNLVLAEKFTAAKIVDKVLEYLKKI